MGEKSPIFLLTTKFIVLKLLINIFFKGDIFMTTHGFQYKTLKPASNIDAILQQNCITGYEIEFVGFEPTPEGNKKVINFYFQNDHDKSKAAQLIKRHL
jgi:hypothetical protein